MISIQQHLAKNRIDVEAGVETVLAQIQLTEEHDIEKYFPGKKVGDWVDYSRTTVEGYLNYREPGQRAVDWITKEEINMDSHYDKYASPFDARRQLDIMAQRIENAQQYLRDESEANFTLEVIEISNLATELADFVRGM